MNAEPIDYLKNHLPLGVTLDMVYKEIIHYIYWDVLLLGSNMKDIVKLGSLTPINRFGFWDRPMTITEATVYFIQQYSDNK